MGGSPVKEYKYTHTGLCKTIYQNTVFENNNPVYKKVPRANPRARVTERATL